MVVLQRHREHDPHNSNRKIEQTQNSVGTFPVKCTAPITRNSMELLRMVESRLIIVGSLMPPKQPDQVGESLHWSARTAIG